MKIYYCEFCLNHAPKQPACISGLMTVRQPLTTTFHLRVVVTILPEEEENYSESSYLQACKTYGIRLQTDFTY
jgi:hypothetical protein